MMQKFEPQREFSVDEEFPLTPEGAGEYKTETYNQWVYDPIQKIGLNIWFASGQNGGGKPFPEFMCTVIVFRNGKTYTNHSDGYGNHAQGIAAGNAFLTMIEPYKRWRIEFLGLLQDNEGPQGGSGLEDLNSAQSERMLSRMDLIVEIVSPPIEQGTQGDRGDVASSGTVPRTAIRYEQLCRISGLVQLGAERMQVSAYGMRSHRRNSASIYDSGAVGHTWVTALFPSGRGFHLLSYQIQPRAEVGFLYGHYFDGKRYHDAKVVRFPYFSGVDGTERYTLELSVEGKLIEFELESHTPLINAPSKGPRLTRAPARLSFDGEIGGGVLERSLFVEFATGGEYIDRSER